MSSHSVFLSVVLPLRDQSAVIEPTLRRLVASLTPLVADFELIVVDNGSTDDGLRVLERLVGPDGLPNVQVYALVKAVDQDAAAWAGVESALGDYVVVADPLHDDLDFIPTMLERAVSGADIVLAANRAPRRLPPLYALAERVFRRLYLKVAGVDLAEEAGSFRLISRRVVNYVLQHKQPVTTYRFLAAASGFARAKLDYSMPRREAPRARLREDAARAARLLVSTTHAPMRVVSTLCLFGAGANVAYSLYVIAVALLKADVAPGWVTLSLVQSGMFFLISLVLFVVGEYVVHVAGQAGGGPPYYVARELTSARLTRRERFNVDEPAAPAPPLGPWAAPQVVPARPSADRPLRTP